MDDEERATLQAYCDTVECLILEAQEKLAEFKAALAEQE